MITTNDNDVVIKEIVIEENTIGKSLIVSNKELKFEKENSIEDNEFANSSAASFIKVTSNNISESRKTIVKSNTGVNAVNSMIETDKDIVVEQAGELEVVENTISRTSDWVQVLLKAGNYDINHNGKLVVRGNKLNCVSTSTTNNKVAAVMYIGVSKYINVSTSSIVVKENIQVGATAERKENHFYGVYSENKEGFIKQVDGKIRATVSYIENIVFSSEDGEGTIYSN